MEVVDPASAARRENCAAVFNGELARGVTPQEIWDGCQDAMARAEQVGNISRLEDFQLIASFAKEYIDFWRQGVEQGKVVSDRMAVEQGNRRARKEVSLDVLEAWQDLGYNRPRPSFDQLQERRYGPDWRKKTGRNRGRDGL